jgi:hypothetical protein
MWRSDASNSRANNILIVHFASPITTQGTVLPSCVALLPTLPLRHHAGYLAQLVAHRGVPSITYVAGAVDHLDV